MIVRSRPNGIALLLAMRGSVLPIIAPRLALVLAIAVVAVAVHQAWPGHFPQISPAPFTLLGLGVSIFLGFRNNACYERWWEGRKQWGALVSISRALLRDIATLLPEPDSALKRRAAARVAAFAHALRDQLRDAPPAPAADWLPAGGQTRLNARRNRALLVQQIQAEEFTALYRQGALSDILLTRLCAHLDAMTAIQAACERLRNTPLPFAYSLMLHRSVWLFCLILPFAMVDSLNIVTPVLSLVLAYAFLGLDALGEELEEPFGQTANALPLDAMVRAIEISAAEAQGEAPPPPLAPRDFVLL
ncbi:bestrophin family protein [Acidocella sp.]|uniref:bestrophin family protein n=1 Tax=Acidocella sp. TaxID=50710 RepID=UPI00262BC1C2|nr:bestrophin family ion channel [Acidocella sp.]